MRRRAFMMAFGSAALSGRFAAQAQQPAMPVIGFLSGGSSERWRHLVSAFIDGLGEGGYAEGRNVAIAYRWADGDYERLNGLAAELVARPVAVIVATGGGARVVKALPSTIPVVASFGTDPVTAGTVASLSHPGGNITGVSLFNATLAPKRLELLRELVPTAEVIGMLVNPKTPKVSDDEEKDVEAATRAAGRALDLVRASTAAELDAAFAALVERKAGALLVGTDPFFVAERERIVALADRHAIPAVYEWREFALAGGLMSYGASQTGVYRELGHYTAMILKGAKPADLPVLQPSKFELVINLKTAKALGLTVPPSLLARADEVIE